MIEYYTGLLADSIRIDAFQQSITNAVRSDDVVVDLGSGIGTFAIFAARAGARRVFGIESETVIEFARQLAQLNDADVEFIRGNALDLELPEPATLLIFEDFSSGLLDGSTRALLKHALPRWMARDFRVLPERASLHVAPIQSTLARTSAFPLEALEDHPYGINLEPIQRAAQNTVIDLRSPADLKVLAEPQLVLDHPLQEPLPTSWSVARVLDIEGDGEFDGLCLWLDFQLDSHTTYSNQPAGSGVYGQLFFPVPSRWTLKTGDKLIFNLRYEAVAKDGVWAWSAEVHRRGEAVEQRFSGNTFAASFLTSHVIQRYDPNRVVQLTEPANLEALVLSLVDGKRTIQQISVEVQQQLGKGDSAQALEIVLGCLDAHSLL